MNIEKSFINISYYFDAWVKVMELQTRSMEVHDSELIDKHILIISPPTDRGIVCLTDANSKGETILLCFTKELEKIANKYAIKHNIENLFTCVESFFSIPFPNNYFDAVFTNCLFDFCDEGEFDMILNEIKRVLKKKGLLFSAYMEPSKQAAGKIWSNLFNIFPKIVGGCHPVNIRPSMERTDFKLRKDVSVSRFGFPIKYIIAEELHDMQGSD